ncbi:MAG: hypothetical protein ABGX00_08135 [Allomuricauda sp.]
MLGKFFRNIIIATILSISVNCFSQKQYEFDYLIEYELHQYKDTIKIKNRSFFEKDIKRKKYYLTNSKRNNYTAVITDLDSLHYQMSFKDQEGILFNAKFLKSEFINTQYLSIDCQNITSYKNPFKYQTKNYAFSKLNDTVINGEPYGKYKLASNNMKKTKRMKLGTEFYVIDYKTSFHLPILDFSTAYEEWKQDGKLPNGIFLEKYFVDYYGHLDSKEKLISFKKVDKKILIDSDCDYTVKN